MKKLFEIPELLTLDGTTLANGIPIEGKDKPNTCNPGCDKGCEGGGCFPGSG